MKGITMCADCAYYNMKTHKCIRGCTGEPDTENGDDVRFFTDCPLPNVAEVRHGRWIHSDVLDYKDPNGVIHVHGMCSCCRLIYDFRDMTSRFKFCPNCGSRMDGGAKI